MIAPCYQCPEIFDNAEERNRHVVHSHARGSGKRYISHHGRGKTITEFARRASPDQIRRGDSATPEFWYPLPKPFNGVTVSVPIMVELVLGY